MCLKFDMGIPSEVLGATMIARVVAKAGVEVEEEEAPVLHVHVIWM